MNIDILQLVEGARIARGLTVVIDVFRAFSTACYLFEAGADRVIPVENVEEALRLKSQMNNVVLIGERSERKVPGFDYGNSPTHIKDCDFRGKTIVMTTSSGTKGIANAIQADEIITGSFVNAAAIVRYIRIKNPDRVSLVGMGYECRYPTQEDTFLAQYVKGCLENNEPDFGSMKQILRTGDGARLFDPANQKWSPASDFDLCLDRSHFDFVLKIEKGSDFNFLRKIVI